MRFKFVFIVPVISAVCSVPVAAKIDPAQCLVEANLPAAPCHFTFRSDGTLDALQIHVRLRDVFKIPVGNCQVRATVRSAGSSTLALCACAGCATQLAWTDIDGHAYLTFRKIGGRGELTVVVESLCEGTIVIGSVTIPFTSPDLDGSGSGANPAVVLPCASAPASATDILDLAIWAAGLSPSYNVSSDFDCSGAPIDILDLATWAGGLGRGCEQGCP